MAAATAMAARRAGEEGSALQWRRRGAGLYLGFGPGTDLYIVEGHGKRWALTLPGDQDPEDSYSTARKAREAAAYYADLKADADSAEDES